MRAVGAGLPQEAPQSLASTGVCMESRSSCSLTLRCHLNWKVLEGQQALGKVGRGLEGLAGDRVGIRRAGRPVWHGHSFGGVKAHTSVPI